MPIKWKYDSEEVHLEIYEDGKIFHYYGSQILPLFEEIPGLKEYIKGVIAVGKKSSHSDSARKRSEFWKRLKEKLGLKRER